MKPKPMLVTCLLALALAAAGCDPIGRGIVSNAVPESQLRLTQHPTHQVHWFPRALGPAASGDFRCLAIADFDGDQLPDLAAGGFDRRGIRVWLANGDGTWSSTDGPRFLGMPTGLAVGDVNGDGRPDIVIAGQGEVPGVRVWLNTLHTKEAWTEGRPATITQAYLAVKVRDVNGDGRLDIIAARERNGGRGGIGVWINRGKQGWSGDVGPKASVTYNDIALADFNKDGFLDVVAARWGNPGGLDIWYGNGQGAWSRAQEDPALRLNFQGVDVGDFNGDGETDIVATSYRSDLGVCIFLNDRHVKDRRPEDRGAGWWSTPVQLTGKGSFWDAKAVDLNGDNLLDVVVTCFDGRGVRAWLQLPRENRLVPKFIEQSWNFPHKGMYYAVDTADFNTDKKLDVAAVSRDEGVRVWFQTLKKDGRVAPSPHRRVVPLLQKLPRPYGEVDEAPQDPTENNVFITMARKDGRKFHEYRIGPGDELRIAVYAGRHAKADLRTWKVEPSGELLMPLVSAEPLRVVDSKGHGLSPSQLRNLIREKLAKDTFKDPHVSVTVFRHLSRAASVLGQIRIKVNQTETGPGRYALTGKTRVLAFIARHGGFTERADLTKVEVRNRDGEKRVVNLFKAVFQSQLSQDIILDEGDVVYIPSTAMSDRKIHVLGEVGKPGVYELQDNVRLIEAIQLAQSFTRAANRKQIIVVRGDKNNPELFEINLLDMLRNGDLSKNMLLETGDVVFVPKNWIANLREFYTWFLPGYNQVTE